MARVRFGGVFLLVCAALLYASGLSAPSAATTSVAEQWGVAPAGGTGSGGGEWSGSATESHESPTRSTTYEGNATINLRGGVYELSFEITSESMNFDHEGCFTSTVTVGEASAEPNESGLLVFVSDADQQVTSDCPFYESKGGYVEETIEYTIAGYLLDDNVIQLDLLPQTSIEMAGATTEPEWGVIVNDDGTVELVPPPDGGVLNISRQDLPPWVRYTLVTVGAQVADAQGAEVAEGDPQVLIDGVPVARLGDGTSHGGIIVDGTDSVLVNGKQAAFVGAMTVCPQLYLAEYSGKLDLASGAAVPHVGGPIIFPGARPSDFFTSELPPQTQATLRALAEYELQLDQWWGRCDSEICLSYQQEAEEALLERLRLISLEDPAAAGDVVIEGDFDGIEIGDGVLIGDGPSDIAVVADKGSLVLDEPLRYDHPAGTLVMRIDASAVEEARATVNEALASLETQDVEQSSTAPAESTDGQAAESSAEENDDSNTLFVLTVGIVAVLAVALVAVIFLRRRKITS